MARVERREARGGREMKNMHDLGLEFDFSERLPSSSPLLCSRVGWCLQAEQAHLTLKWNVG